LDSGNLDSAITNAFTLGTNNLFVLLPPNTNSVKLGVAVRTGILKGSFFHPSKGSTPIWGAVLQDQKEAFGFFIGTNQSGSMRLNAD
jgi:hypothetical protein